MNAHDLRISLLQNIPAVAYPLVKTPYYCLNWCLAKKPTHVIIGTGRCGTGFTANYLSKYGIVCSHEGFYTPEGPLLRNKNRFFKATVDASWLAVPLLPDPDIKPIHQVRHPYGVISSFYKLGFFTPEYYSRNERYVDFARQYFEFGDDPLHSCIRWYIDWNGMCEKVTSNRYQLENIAENADMLTEWLGLKNKLPDASANAPSVNARTGIIEYKMDSLIERIRRSPDFNELVDAAGKYGYELA